MPVRYASRNSPPPRPPEDAPDLEDPSDPDLVYEWAPSGRRGRAPERGPAPPRSHAAAFVAVGLLVVGALLMSWTILIPALLALLLFSAGLSFLSARLNPLSIGFYLTTKPSWSSIGVIFLSGVLLLGLTYEGWKQGWGPLLPHQLWPRL
jgi:hypothetical protein